MALGPGEDAFFSLGREREAETKEEKTAENTQAKNKQTKIRAEKNRWAFFAAIMSGFSESALDKKLSDLNSSAQSIQQLSLWVIHHRKHYKVRTTGTDRQYLYEP